MEFQWLKSAAIILLLKNFGEICVISFVDFSFYFYNATEIALHIIHKVSITGIPVMILENTKKKTIFTIQIFMSDLSRTNFSFNGNIHWEIQQSKRHPSENLFSYPKRRSTLFALCYSKEAHWWSPKSRSQETRDHLSAQLFPLFFVMLSIDNSSFLPVLHFFQATFQSMIQSLKKRRWN